MDAVAAYGQLTSADDYDWSWDAQSEEVNGYRKQVEDLIYLMTGTQYDFSANDVMMWEYADKATASWKSMTDAEAKAREQVEKYQTAVNGANTIQKAFVDNLVSGVREGGMSLEQVEGLLTETFAKTYNGAALVEQIMSQVKAELEGASEAAEGMGTGMESTKASAEQVNAAIAPIIAQMEALGNAYQEAYDKAYSSMDGQFKLFEEAPELTKASVDDMISALQSQQAYMEQYATNL